MSRDVPRARRLRKQPTFAEASLWKILRDRRLGGLKFRRQVPLGSYVIDFACLERRLLIELDGGIHDAPFYDQDAQERRAVWLQGQGFRLVRFRNAELENAPHRVLEAILSEIGQGGATPHPAAPQPPSPARGEGEAR